MSIATDKPLRFEGRQYTGANRIGFEESGSFILDLFTTPPPEPRGGYFTVLPISPKHYRQTVHKTMAGFRDDSDSLVVFCDWGQPFRIEAERAVLDALIAECREQDLIEEPAIAAA